MVCQQSTVEIWTHSTRLLDISFLRWSIFAWLTSIFCCHTPQDPLCSYIWAASSPQFEASVRRTNGLTLFGNRITGLRSRFSRRATKAFSGFYPIARAPVILSLSGHSTMPRLPQMMECDRGSSLQVPRTIVLPSSWWYAWLGESFSGFFHRS